MLLVVIIQFIKQVLNISGTAQANSSACCCKNVCTGRRR